MSTTLSTNSIHSELAARQISVNAQVKSYDTVLLLAVSTLMMIGIIMISSASIDVADVKNGNPFYYLIRHGSFAILGIIAGLIVYQLPTVWWQKTGWLALSVSLILLTTVLIIGREVNGSTRWIGMGGLNIQPSELAKLLLISYLAGYLVRRREEVMNSWWGFVKPVLVLLVVAILLLMEPDFGATVVIGAAFMGMIFLSGAKLGQFMVLIVACLVAAWGLIVLSPYRWLRMTSYTDPWAHKYDSGYQLTQSLIAFGRGEWTGLGLGNSIQKQFFLPEAHTDFVFAILAEEFGLIGTVFVVLLFSVVVYRALKIGNLAEKKGQLFSAYFAYGIGLLLGVQSFINIGVNMGVLPTKGLTLPLVSYGGSSLIVSCMLIGILARIYSEMVQIDTRINRDESTKSGGNDERQ